jgi:hypothetical protein
MDNELLFIIDSDPRQSARPAEAVRIAAGISAWRRVAVRLYLRGPAVLVLSEFPDDLLDDENYTRYLPILAESNHPVLVERGTPFLAEIGQPALKYQEVSLADFAKFSAKARYATRF